MSQRKQTKYSAIIEEIFHSKFKPGMREIDFERGDMVKFGNMLGIDLPKNLSDLLYTFRSRADLPATIRQLAPEGESWIIRGVGRSKYRFALIPTRLFSIIPNENMTVTKVPDFTPGLLLDMRSMVNRHFWQRYVTTVL